MPKNYKSPVTQNRGKCREVPTNYQRQIKNHPLTPTPSPDGRGEIYFYPCHSKRSEESVSQANKQRALGYYSSPDGRGIIYLPPSFRTPIQNPLQDLQDYEILNQTGCFASAHTGSLKIFKILNQVQDDSITPSPSRRGVG